ncbi:unnamed protein product [Arctia plantaginis]|uniref:Uncharacterized protein n=1 Tax=Arctia plantaginis TaxID=874455 RepID=A0A8S1ACK2_ARCPL|nr:unnamed protein product [Arctia plantaginis]
MKCNGCLKNVVNANCIKCSSQTCDKNFCSMCINVCNMSVEKKKNWRCLDCCAMKKKVGDNSLTPVRPADDNVTLRKKCNENSDDTLHVEVRQLTEEVRLLTRDIASLKGRLENATSGLTSCQARLYELASSTASNDSRLKTLEGRDKEVKLLENKAIELQQEINF